MKIAVLAPLVALTCGQRSIQPASTQVLQFIDQNGDSIPVRPVGQQQQFQPQQFAPQQQQQFAPQQQQRFAPQPQQTLFNPQQQQQVFNPIPPPQQFAPQQQQQQFARIPQQQQQQRFIPQPQPQQQQLQAQPQHPVPTHLLQANAQEAAHHRNAVRQQQELINLQRQHFSPHQLEAQQEFDSRPPPEFLPLDNAPQFSGAQKAVPQRRPTPQAVPQRRPAPQQFNQFPAPAPQQRRPAPQPRPAPQQRRPAPQPRPQQFSQFPAVGAAPQARPAPQQRRPAPQQRQPAPRPQPVREPGSVNDELGQLVVESEAYVHDPTGDNTLSRFQLFQLRKKQEAAAQSAGQA